MTWIPDYLKDLATANYGMWNSPTPGLHPNGSITPGEGGVDVGTPNGTPVYAIADGIIIGSGYWKDSGHGVVTTRVEVPGVGLEDLYYQHIQIAPGIQAGQEVHRGQLIGTIGPYNEIEMGFNALWGYPWQSGPHPGPWIADPRPWLWAILNGNPTIPTTSSSGTSSSGTGNPIFDAILPNFTQWAEYTAIFLIALVLIILGFVLLGGNDTLAVAKKAVAA